jgi:hypothetical protein
MNQPLLDCIEALGRPGQPGPLYAALDTALAEIVGYKLLTLLYITADGREVERAYSSNPAAYPVRGRKPMRTTEWGERVMKNALPYIGRTRADIRWAFPDHELIESLGLGAVINLPVVYDGRCVGTINLLNAEGYYDEPHLPLIRPFAPLLIAPFLAAGR